jgi:membrane protease YdiL (CAAX protease family)
MVAERKESIGYALTIYVVFVALVAVANVVYGGPAAAATGGRAVLAEALLYVGAVALVGLAVPLWLAARGRLALPIWPSPGTGDNAFAVLLVVFAFARVEMLVAIFAEGRPWGRAAVTFLGAAAFNLAVVTATIGVLLPALKRRMPVAAATLIAALAFSLCHIARFNSFAGALSVEVLVVLIVFGLGYSLYYFWSRSLFLTALLLHLVATTNMVYARNFEPGHGGVPFYYSLTVLVAFLIVVVAKRRLYAAERFTHF